MSGVWEEEGFLGQHPEILPELDAPSEGSGSRTSKADELVYLALANCSQLFRDQFNNAYAQFLVDDHHELARVRGNKFKIRLAGLYWTAKHKAVTDNVVNSALNVLEAKARFESNQIHLHNRVAWRDGALYYDLSDERWRAVRITSSGWEIVSNPPILFRRYAHQQPQVEPIPGGDLDDIFNSVRIKRAKDQLLFKSFLGTALVPEIPHPILAIHGDQGSGKTWVYSCARQLVDPSIIHYFDLGRDPRELVQNLMHHYCCFFDNLSHLPDWLSDMLCRAVTGAGQSKRELYSDDDDVIYAYRRIIGVNGINLVATKPDVLDRCLVIQLERIPESERKSEEDLQETYDAARPKLLGALFDAVSAAMRIRPTTRLSRLPRMADFAAWAAALAVAGGASEGDFLAAYHENTREQNTQALHASSVALCTLELMKKQSEWEGTGSQLLQEFSRVQQVAGVSEKDLPRNANWVKRRLREVKSNLQAEGIELDLDGRTAEKRYIRITRGDGENGVSGVNTVTPPATTEDSIEEGAESADGRYDASQYHGLKGQASEKRVDDTNDSDDGSPKDPAACERGELWEEL